MLRILKKINILMDKRQKLSMLKLLIMMVISAGLESGAAMMVMAVVQVIILPTEQLVSGSTYQQILAHYYAGTELTVYKAQNN